MKKLILFIVCVSAHAFAAQPQGVLNCATIASLENEANFKISKATSSAWAPIGGSIGLHEIRLDIQSEIRGIAAHVHATANADGSIVGIHAVINNRLQNVMAGSSVNTTTIMSDMRIPVIVDDQGSELNQIVLNCSIN